MASALYQEGLTQFRNTIKPQKDRDREILNSFLKERESPEGVKQTAVELKESADGKYDRDLGPIPKEWIANILGNIDRAIDIGDFAAKGGPESVGMAWMVVKLTLGAIRENYELYKLFGVGLTTVTEIMTIIPHYDKLYDNRGKAGAAATTAYMDNLFSNMRNAYSATLTFRYTIDAFDFYFGEIRGPSERYRPGDTVGAGFDCKEGIIWFTRNGKYMAPAIDNVCGRMFPAIGVDDEIVVETNFGPEDFLWDGAWDPDGGPLEVVEDGETNARVLRKRWLREARLRDSTGVRLN
ncbi:hypothetical protein PRZ48_007360 [Zasmidium cellare]|uniref:SPRY domain-containing protein n=1 Tax=Zasmidium cellare TaxID=395010 RepID=A0ABR0EJV1_ZASCE|nr:hypothetical protein PRZ48_007360 [Zasmidium cellare]